MRPRGEKPLIGVHIDLKGMQFKPSYDEIMLADLAGQGVNAVLVEYEDVFPFEGVDVAWDERAVWRPRRLKRFLRAAAEAGIKVIPLQQCLGHLEYAFRWKRYRRFAEDTAYPSTVRLGDPDARAFVVDMLRQVLAAHPDGRYIHLGMDEAHAMTVSAWTKKHGGVVPVFLDWLRELCDVCDEYETTPVIWTDMLQDHFDGDFDRFDEFRERVVFCPWDYGCAGPRSATLRLCGSACVSREWLDDFETPDAPPVSPGTPFIEDMPEAALKALEPHRRGRSVRTLCHVDLFTDMGFRVIGAGGLRVSRDGPLFPFYNDNAANLRAWAAAIKRTRQLGVIGTSWARGTTFCPPNFPIDAQWPLVGALAEATGATPEPFFDGVSREDADRLFGMLGRSRWNWRMEGAVAEEMRDLSSSVASHRYEWDGVALLAEVMAYTRRADFCMEEVEYFDCNDRLPVEEWDRRMAEQKAALADTADLRKRVKKHFGARYRGDAFDEWVRELFSLRETKLRAARSVCVAKKKKIRSAMRT